jgi:hypothetical protein
LYNILIGVLVGAAIVKCTLLLDYWRARRLLKERERVSSELLKQEAELTKQENNRIVLRLKE